jgi:hypothetical protein
MTGALAAYMVLLATAPHDSPSEYALLRRHIELLSGWLLVPSLALVLLTGLLSMAVHTPFQNARWAWLKLALGLPVFEGTLVTIDGTAQQAAALSARAAAGELDAAAVPALVAHEWNTLWIIMALALAQTVIGVWRPRLRSRRRS